MAHRCVISKQANQFGHRVSHANNKSKHTFRVNLQSKRVYVPWEKSFVKVRVSTRILRTIDKLGLRATLKSHNITLRDIAAN